MAANKTQYKSERGVQFDVSGETEGWRLDFNTEKVDEGIELVTWKLSADKERQLPELKVYFAVPHNDMQIKWFPLNTLAQCHHYLPCWWDGRKISTGLAHDAPVFCYLNQAGENRLTFAISDAKRTVNTMTGTTEESLLTAEFTLFSTQEAPVREVEFSIRLDSRAESYAEVLGGFSDWYASIPGYEPAAVPDAAEQPLYSTWYQYQKDVFQDDLERELPLIAEHGMKTIILDDGWQCLESQVPGNSAYANCGAWQPVKEKFPDIAAHVKKFHEYGIKYMVWFAVPFVGVRSPEIHERFKGKYLREGEVCVLDPRYPEVREYLIQTYERAVREWDIDGLKLDFIDSFRLSESDPAAANNYDGCDIKSLSDAVDCLMSDVLLSLKALKPDILIEFRQHYNGPAMRKYGNMLRASDCAYDVLQNRMRIVDLRLLAGNTAVHSDMLIWSPNDSAEAAALQILNILFSVPQVSVRLQGLSEEHSRMLKFWMSFWTEHRDTLLYGKFLPENPENSYPVVKSYGAEEAVIAVYEPAKFIELPRRKIYLINASHADKIAVELERDAKAVLHNVFGEVVGEVDLSAGLHRLTVPQSGFAVIE